MSDHDQTPPVQYINLDNIESAAVFVAPEGEFTNTRVYYDLDTLVTHFRRQLIPQILKARLTNDDLAMANLAGAAWLLDEVDRARETHLLEAQFALPDAE